MGCKKCQDGYVYVCNNCAGYADYDSDLGIAICNICSILGEKHNAYSYECPNCTNDILNYNLKDVALKLHELGMNITCISRLENEYNKNTSNFFKTPSHLWHHLSRHRQSQNEIESYDWINAIGIGTVTMWSGLVVIDIDGCNDSEFLLNILSKLGLPSNYEWVVQSGSKNGFHIYILGDKIDECKEDDVVSTFPPKEKFEKYFDKIEFLWETHCVLPPSVHGSGNRYNFLNNTFPKSKPFKVESTTIYGFIEEYLEYSEIVQGQTYGGLSHKIFTKEEFVSEINNEDITKYLVDDIFCIVDIETSGFPQKVENSIIYPELLQVAWILTNSKGILIKKKSFIIKSNYFISNKNSEFINIDFDAAKIVGYELNDVMKRFVEDLKISDYVVAHNIEFDIDVLSHYITKIYGSNPFKNKQLICTMKSTVNFCKISNNYGYKFPKLSELFYKLFDYKIQNSHNAEVDVLHTLKCFKKLKTIGII